MDGGSGLSTTLIDGTDVRMPLQCTFSKQQNRHIRSHPTGLEGSGTGTLMGHLRRAAHVSQGCCPGTNQAGQVRIDSTRIHRIHATYIAYRVFVDSSMG